MQNGKKLFSMLAGIFLMAVGSIWLILQLLNAGNMIQYAPLNLVANLQLDLLILLAGLFLLLRKTTPAAIMMLAASLFVVVSYLQAIIGMVRYGSFNALTVINFLLAVGSFVLFGVGLLLKKTGALVMCIIAAGIRLILLVLSFVRTTGMTLRGVFSILATLLLIGGIVMAGLYKKSCGEPEPQYGGVAYPQDGYYPYSQQ